MFKVYQVRQNTDLMEGKGRMEVQATFTNDGAALTFIMESLPTDMGGSKSAAITEVPVFETTSERNEYLAARKPEQGTQVWGYRKDWRGVWGEGWLDNRDAPTNDPDYAEFQRLRKKFHDD